MKIALPGLQKYFEKPLLTIEKIADALTFHAFEIESIEGDVLDVKVLPNRAADCLSHLGIAKELSAILDIPLKQDPLREELAAFPATKELRVEIEDPKKCLRYSAALVKGVKVGPSPTWLKETIESVGQRSINNIVDAMNFAMLDIQPLHAFDAARLAQKDGAYAITVRSAKAGEKITVLTDEEYALAAGMLLIADGANGAPLAIAGIKGGKESGISEATTDIVIESGNFDGTSVRRTAQALKLFTDASLRFQNRPSPELVAYGLSHALDLIEQVAGGELAGVVDEYPARSDWHYKVGVSAAEINRVLGSAFTENEVEETLKRFGWQFELVESPMKKVVAMAPALVGATYKYHSAIRVDAPATFSCSSFTNYLYVQAGIAMPSLSVDQYAWGQPIKIEELQPGDLVFSNSNQGDGVRYETVGYLPGTKVPEGVDHVGLYLGDGKVIHSAKAAGGVVIEDLKTSSGFKNIVGCRRVWGAGERRFVITVPFERVDIRIKEDLIEEVGRIIGYDKIVPKELPALATSADQARYRGGERMKDQLVEQGFTEVSTQSFAKKGDIALANPLDKAKPFLRTTLEENLKDALAQAKHYAPLVLAPNEKPKLFEVGTVFPKSGEFVELRMTETVPAWGDNFPTHDNLSVAKLEEYGKDYEPKKYELGAYKAFSIYPFILRDIALWCPRGTESVAVEKVIRENASELLVRLDQFDRFEKEGRVSYAFRMVFESMERTLTDDEVNGIMEKVSVVLRAAGYEVR